MRAPCHCDVRIQGLLLSLFSECMIHAFPVNKHQKIVSTSPRAKKGSTLANEFV